MKLAFSMQAGSTAVLCATYETDPRAVTILPSGVSSGSYTTSLYGNLNQVNATLGSSGYGWTYSYMPVPGAVITANPSAVTVNANDTAKKITVAYTITVPKGEEGYYSLTFTNACPTLIPFAVVSGQVELSAADFPGFLSTVDCNPLQGALNGGVVVGYTGLETAWITG